MCRDMIAVFFVYYIMGSVWESQHDGYDGYIRMKLDGHGHPQMKGKIIVNLLQCVPQDLQILNACNSDFQTSGSKKRVMSATLGNTLDQFLQYAYQTYRKNVL